MCILKDSLDSALGGMLKVPCLEAKSSRERSVVSRSEEAEGKVAEAVFGSGMQAV